MSFNTNYILPGDDKNQIIGKVNYNFSQVLSNAVGLPGQSGILGATGIIGQVGKDGSIGSTGTRANKWYFQQTPPFGDIPYSQAPLINYDVWVDTSPGATGGPNRIYQYNKNYTFGQYPFWVDTDSNFAIDSNFTLLQGVSGPGEVTEKNAIVIGSGGTSPAETTFVFTDRSVTANNANPRYSKILVESDTSTTASLPLFSFGKTFYTKSDLPSFFWQNTGDNYDIKFSSGGEMFIQSQATGTYSSTGETASLVASGINWNSSTTASIIGPSGISINASTLGLSSLNVQLQTGGLSLPSMNTGMGATSSGSDYALSINGSLLDSQTGERTVLGYAGFYGGTRQNSLFLGVSGANLFTVGNSPAASQINATTAALGIGYTGSQGVSGGTGANIVKSYQSITSSASSTSIFNGLNINNYIQVTPSSDVIVINAVPTGPVSSDGRSGRIWLLLTGIDSYLEAGNASCIDIFLNGSTTSIGGISVPTNYSYAPSEYYIRDFGATTPGPTGGCRHVRINFYGSSFPISVNTSANRFFYLEAFSSGYNASTQLPYFYSSVGGTQLTVICTELHRQGFMPDDIREADERFGRMISETSPETMAGYHYWAIPIVNLMRKSRLFTKIVWTVAKPWAYQMAYEMGAIEKGNVTGKILMKIGIFASNLIGKIISAKNPQVLNKLTNF